MAVRDSSAQTRMRFEVSLLSLTLKFDSKFDTKFATQKGSLGGCPNQVCKEIFFYSFLANENRRQSIVNLDVFRSQSALSTIRPECLKVPIQAAKTSFSPLSGDQ